MIELLKIYVIFFKIGFFTVGGGLAALPLLQNEAITRGWITKTEFADIIAVSQSTPGPIGINMATYVGFKQMSIGGSIIATLGMVTPSIIIICIISKLLATFNKNKWVQYGFYGLRPAVIGLIAAAAFQVATIAIFRIDQYKATKNIAHILDIKALILFTVLLVASNKWKKGPVFYIIISAFAGIMLW